jgi:hypothetical protein
MKYLVSHSYISTFSLFATHYPCYPSAQDYETTGSGPRILTMTPVTPMTPMMIPSTLSKNTMEMLGLDDIAHVDNNKKGQAPFLWSGVTE